MRMLTPLRHRDFRLLWIGQSVSQIGNALYMVALPFQILALGGSPLQLGVGFTVFITTQLVVVLFGGAIVDRLSRRHVILATDLASGIVVGVIALLGLTGHLQIPYLYLTSAFFGLAFSFYGPAMQAIMPQLVPAEILMAGNALRGLAGQSARVAGPLLGGLVVARGGPPVGFAIDAATFFFSFGVFYLANPPKHEQPPPNSLLRQMRDGISFTFSVRWLWLTIVGFGFTNGFYFACFSVALPLLVLQVLHGTPATFGFIGAATGVGEVVGGLLAGNLRIKRFGVALYVGNALLGLSAAAHGVPLLPIVLCAAAGFGASIVFTNTVWESALQKHVPAQLLGRVTSVDNFGSFLVGPVAPIAAAAAIPLIGPSAIFFIAGGVAVSYCMSVLALSRTIRDLR
ncbi:MAG: MFS transporter [Candidatus Dormibacterales bacterium]